MLQKFLIFLVIQQCFCQYRRPPLVEQNPILLNSYIPASMQIIAYLSESMKYDLKPSDDNPMITTTTTTTTTTTMSPTRSHKPGIFAPPKQPQQYNSGEFLSYQDYIERLLNPPNDYNYFDRYKYPFIERNGRYLNINNDDDSDGKIPKNYELLVGKEVKDLLKLTNSLDDDGNVDDFDEQTLKFLENYDDYADFRGYLKQQKKQPPTRAFVSLLSLYDLLSKEAKKLGFNKFNGYTENILNELVEISTGTSTDQLKFVLQRIVDNQEVRTPQLVKRLKDLLIDLNNSSSYICTSLRYIPPLKFTQ